MEVSASGSAGEGLEAETALSEVAAAEEATFAAAEEATFAAAIASASCCCTSKITGSFSLLEGSFCAARRSSSDSIETCAGTTSKNATLLSPKKGTRTGVAAWFSSEDDDDDDEGEGVREEAKSAAELASVKGGEAAAVTSAAVLVAAPCSCFTKAKLLGVQVTVASAGTSSVSFHDSSEEEGGGGGAEGATAPPPEEGAAAEKKAAESEAEDGASGHLATTFTSTLPAKTEGTLVVA